MSACVPAFKLWLACWQTNILKEVIEHMSIKRADLGQIIPTITVNTNVELLEPGSSPKVVSSGTGLDQELRFSFPKGEKGEKGEKGDKGETGEKGDPFTIYKTYPTVKAMQDNVFIDKVPGGAFVLIAGIPIEKDGQPTGEVNVNEPDVGKLYVRNTPYEGETSGTEAYTFLTDLSGAQGIQGEKGAKGDKGEDGIDGEDGLTYSYSFAIGGNGHLYVFFDDEGKDPTSQNAGMAWQNWTAAAAGL